MNATETYAELVNLRDQCGPKLYHRVKLADNLLADRGWVTSLEGGGGDEGTALDRLEEDCFGDTALTLPELLEVYHAIPQEAEWKKRRWNLKRMHREFKDRQRATRQARNPQREGNLQSEAMRQMGEIQQLRQENRELQRQVQMLTRENKVLRKKLTRIMADIGNLQEA